MEANGAKLGKRGVVVEEEAAREAAGAANREDRGWGFLQRVIRYGRKVYGLGSVLGRVRDARVRPRVSMSTVLRAGLLCGLLRVRSFNALEPQLAEPCMWRALGREPGDGRGQALCSVDTLSRVLRQADPESFHDMLAALVRAAERKKVFREGLDG